MDPSPHQVFGDDFWSVLAFFDIHSFEDIVSSVLIFIFVFAIFHFVPTSIFSFFHFFSGKPYPRTLTEPESKELAALKEKSQSLSQCELHELGRQHCNRRNYAMAIEVFTLAIEKDAFCDDAVPILMNRSLAHSKVGRHKHAYEDAGFCCGIRPDFADGFERRGDTAEKLKEYEIALESYDECLRLAAPARTTLKKISIEVKRKLVVRFLEQKNNLRAVAANLEKELQEEFSTDDTRPKFEKACELLLYARAWEDFRLIKAAFRFGARLDAMLDVNDANNFIAKQSPRGIFSQRQQEHYRARILASNHSDANIATIATGVIQLIHQKRTSDAIAVSSDTQLDLLDFILDVAEKQGFDLPFCWRKHQMLKDVCLTSIHHALGSSRPETHETVIFRSSVFYLLLRRINTAKKLFFDSNATNEDFATALLLILLQWAQIDWEEREVYDLMKALLNSGAKPNATAWPRSLENCKALFPNRVALFHLLKKMDSPSLVDLLLEFNADINDQVPLTRVNDEDLKGTMLDSALVTSMTNQNTRCFRLIASRGGLLSTESSAIPSKFPAKKLGPLVQPYQSKVMSQIFQISWNKSCSQQHLKLFEEWIDLLFGQFEKQKCSFLFESTPGADLLVTPLTFAILHCHVMSGEVDLEKIRIILTRKPELLHTSALGVSQNSAATILSPVACAVIACLDDDSSFTSSSSSSLVDQRLRLLRFLFDSGADRHGVHITVYDRKQRLKEQHKIEETTFVRDGGWQVERLLKFLEEYDKEAKTTRK